MTNTKQENFLKLRKCAYIFDDLHGYKYGTRETIAEQIKTENHLKEYYSNDEKRAEWIPCEVETVKGWNDEQITKISVNINGKAHRLNALQVDRVKGTAETLETIKTINNRQKITLDHVPTKYKNLTAYTFSNDTIYFKNLKSLSFENFTGAEDLGYLRIKFKNNTQKIIISNGGKFYTAQGVQHNETDTQTIIKQLDATSQKARDTITTILNDIQEQTKI